MKFYDMSHFVRSKGKKTVQRAHCAVQSHQWADQGSLYYYNSEIATSAMVKADQGRAINRQTRAGWLLAMKSKPPSKDVYGDKLYIYSGMYCTILLCAIILYGKRFKT